MLFQGTDIAIVNFRKMVLSLKEAHITEVPAMTTNEPCCSIIITGDISRGDIAVDKEGNIYIASTQLYQSDRNNRCATGKESAITMQWVVKFNDNLSQVIWATYYGGTSP